MNTQLTQKDLEFILTSLKYSKEEFENYQKYPSYDYKQERIKELQEVLNKVENILKEIKISD